MNHTPRSEGYLFAALTVALWCGFVLLSRLGGISVLTPFDVVALRFTPAALVLVPVWLWQRRPAQLFTPRLLVLAAIGGAGYSMLVYAGFKLTVAAHAAILLPGLLPFAIALFSWWLLGERPTTARWLGLALIAGGILVLAASSFGEGARHWRGDLLIVCGSLCWASFTVLARRWQVGAWESTVGCVLLTALFYLPIYWLFLPSAMLQAPAPLLLVQAVYQGLLAVVIGATIYMKAIALLGPNTMGAIMALVPAGAGLLAVPLLHEPLTPALVGGLLLVSSGAYVGSRPTSHLKQEAGG